MNPLVSIIDSWPQSRNALPVHNNSGLNNDILVGVPPMLMVACQQVKLPPLTNTAICKVTL